MIVKECNHTTQLFSLNGSFRFFLAMKSLDFNYHDYHIFPHYEKDHRIKKNNVL